MRLAVERPRVRSDDASEELPLPSYRLFSRTEVLGQPAMERMLAGLSPAATRSAENPWEARSRARQSEQANPPSLGA
jgi:hypothetical protein